VTSNITAMPETAGDAALLVDPRSTEQITRAMEQIVGLPALRWDLRERGLSRALQFSWERSNARVHEGITASAAFALKTDTDCDGGPK
jgi:glycosyltransferase involved in cell wall biosynthesis